ncbi:MAG: cupin domain-containing protein [Vicinamibacterales bacterium]
MIETPGAHVGVGVVYRGKGVSPSGSSAHDKVTEIYQIIEGSGTLVTGGEIVNPQRRDSGGALVGQVNGPGVSGTSIRNGTAQHVGPGDVVIIPAGTPHWFSQVEQPITCSVVRVDPEGIVALK